MLHVRWDGLKGVGEGVGKRCGARWRCSSGVLTCLWAQPSLEVVRRCCWPGRGVWLVWRGLAGSGGNSSSTCSRLAFLSYRQVIQPQIDGYPGGEPLGNTVRSCVCVRVHSPLLKWTENW